MESEVKKVPVPRGVWKGYPDDYVTKLKERIDVFYDRMGDNDTEWHAARSYIRGASALIGDSARAKKLTDYLRAVLAVQSQMAGN